MGEYQRDPRDLGLFATDYSVVWAFIDTTWRTSLQHQDALFSGAKTRVDSRIGPWTFPASSYLSGLGEAVVVRHLGGSEHIYQDGHGVRLILEEHTFPDVLILSAACKHAGKRVRHDLRSLRTESGVGLGESEKRVLRLLGSPSRQYRFGEYQILWYLGKRQHVVVDKGARQHDEGNAAAYVFRRGIVIEIWLHHWSNETIG
jgi:hypothetical protein